MSRVINRCVECGRAGRWGKYCSGKCKQKAYRKRSALKRLGAISGTSEMLISLIGLEDAMEVFDRLNQIVGKSNQTHASEGVGLIIYAVSSILVRERKINRGEE